MPGLSVLLAIVFLLQAGSSPAGETVGFAQDSIARHKLSGRSEVEVMRVADRDDVDVDVTIDPAGHVTAAAAVRAKFRRVSPTLAIREAKQWRFRPFAYRGRPVTATGRIRIAYRPRGIWADRTRDLPTIDYNTLRIGLVRMGCFGDCPSYSVTIAGDGTVTYFSSELAFDYRDREVRRRFDGNGVLFLGTHRARLDRTALDGLIAKLRAARFFGLKHEYRARITDNPTYILTFSSAGRTMEVVDYVGAYVGMPAAVKALEDEVDRVAGTARWTRGDASTLPAFRAAGFDLRSADAVDLARGALRRDNDRLLVELIDAGLPLDQTVLGQAGEAKQPLGVVLLTEALNLRRIEAAKALMARGWLDRMPMAERSTLFADSAGGCDPEIARAFIASGVDPNGRTAASAYGGEGLQTALRSAVSSVRCGYGADRRALVRSLLDLGVDPNRADAAGKTPIFGVDDERLLELLLSRGARPDHRDAAGRSAVFSWTDVITLMLLDAGASPLVRDEKGRTLREHARERNMPGTLAWLDRHKVP